MGFLIKNLGIGVVTATGTVDVYTVPTNMSAIVQNVRVVNAGASTSNSIAFAVKPSGLIARKITKTVTIAASASQIWDDIVTLGQGDKLQMDVTGFSGTNLSWVVSGLERD